MTKQTHIKAAVKRALAKSSASASSTKKQKLPANPNSREDAAMDLNAELLLSDLINDPNIKKEMVTPTDQRATLERQTNDRISNQDISKLRSSTDPYRSSNGSTKISTFVRRETGIKGSRSDSDRVMHYEIDMENDSDLVMLIKREINRMKITPNDIYELTNTPECPFLKQKNDGWNLIYSLRNRKHITYENALKWSVILNKQLVTFVIDSGEYEEFMSVVSEQFPHIWHA